MKNDVHILSAEKYYHKIRTQNIFQRERLVLVWNNSDTSGNE